MKRRVLCTVLSLVFSSIWVVSLGLLLGDSPLRITWLGAVNEFTIQDITWFIFFFGLGELLDRWIDILDESKQKYQRYLPEEDHIVLQASDLALYYDKVAEFNVQGKSFLPNLIKKIILQFHCSSSIEQANNILNTSLEMYFNEVELRYTLLRYLSWLIPTLGFIGTVVGIMNALKEVTAKGVEQTENILGEVVALLSVAFETTLVSLCLSAILIFLMSIVQSAEERVLNEGGQYCLDNLINRLYIPLK